jgi:hypothetical protein
MHVRNHLFSIKAYKNMKNSIFCIAIFIVALFHNSVTLHFALGQSVSEYRPGEILLKLGPHHSIDEVLNSPISKMVGLKIKKYYRYVDIYLLEHDHYQMSSEAILPPNEKPTEYFRGTVKSQNISAFKFFYPQ